MTLIHTGCGLAGLRSLEAGSVDLVFCDLPSGETRASFDNPIDLAEFWPAAWRCLKPAGTAVLMAHSFRFAAEVHRSCSGSFRYDVVWEKGLATGFLNAGNAPLRAHEFLLVFYNQRGTFNPQRTSGHDPLHSVRRRAGHGDNYGPSGADPGRMEGGATDRHPRSVIKTKTVPQAHRRRHPQQKPIPLLQWIVRTYTNPGDLVVDPCAGSGSMGVAAIGDGREFVGWDLEPKPPQGVDLPLFGGRA